jgi:hypothetical protein
MKRLPEVIRPIDLPRPVVALHAVVGSACLSLV